MNTCAIIIIIFQVTCILCINGRAISKPTTHSISKRFADRGISESQSRHKNALERQLLLSKLLNAIDTSSVSPDFDNIDSADVVIQKKSSRKHRHLKGSKSHKRRSRKMQRALEKSLGKILRSEHRDKVLDAIANALPRNGGKARSAIQRIRKLAKSLGDRPCTIN